MFRGILSDKTGFIDLVFFGGNNREDIKGIYDSLKVDKIVKIHGTYGKYNGKSQITIGPDRNPDNYILMASDDEVTIEKFLAESNQKVKAMWSYIEEIIESVENPHLKQLINKFCEDETQLDAFKTMPGAKVYHHACKNGLLEHVWETLQYCEIVTHVHPSLNRDLVMTGALLHDIGKIKENEMYINISETEEGMLLGHIAIGTIMVKGLISQIDGFPEDLEKKLLHIILSHHGSIEKGSIIEPKTAEAAAVSTADGMGSLVTQYIRARKDYVGDDFKTYVKPIGWVHSR